MFNIGGNKKNKKKSKSNSNSRSDAQVAAERAMVERIYEVTKRTSIDTDKNKYGTKRPIWNVEWGTIPEDFKKLDYYNWGNPVYVGLDSKKISGTTREYWEDKAKNNEEEKNGLLYVINNYLSEFLKNPGDIKEFWIMYLVLGFILIIIFSLLYSFIK